ncbi:MAG: hypothetical protein WBQ61_03605 [Candidatus Acidiferrum sp.]
MKSKQEIFREIHMLLDEQSKAINGKLSPIEATEYALRQRKIQELFSLLHNDSSGVSN